MRFLSLLLAALITPQAAKAVVVSRITDFEAGTPIEAEQVDAELDNIIDALNGNLDDDNLSTAAVSAVNIATGAVTQVKLGPKNMASGNSTGTIYRNSEVEAAIANVTAGLTVVSRPVFVGLQSAGGESAPGFVRYLHEGGGATDNQAYISFRRVGSAGTAATINQAAIGVRQTDTSDHIATYPCSAFSFIDQPGAGAFTYTGYFRVATGDSGMLTISNCKLVVFEL